METATKIKPELFQVLIEEIEETFGKRVSTSRDCIQLSEDIYFKTSYTINPNTLRRCFGLVKADYPPSSGTLNILSRYCGFDSFEEMLSLRKARAAGNITQAKAVHDYIVALFKATPVRQSNDETFLGLVRQTIQFLQQYPELIDKIQRSISRTKNGQDYYFEQFVHIDKLNGHYGEGLRYYLNEKKTPEAQVFGHSILCLRAWLSNDGPALKKHFSEVVKIKPTKGFHPFICGRYYAAHLFFADENGLDPERILMDAHNAHASLKPTEDIYRNFPCFEYVFAIALTITKHFQEALYYIDYAQKHYPGKHASIDPGFYKTMQLTKALCLFMTGERKGAEKFYAQIRPAQFYFLTRKINTILYVILEVYLRKNTTTAEEQLAELVRQTGFTRFLQYTHF
jgi:hypothetical protein